MKISQHVVEVLYDEIREEILDDPKVLSRSFLHYLMRGSPKSTAACILRRSSIT